MKFFRWLASFIIGTIIFVVGVYFVIFLCVAYFILTGQLTQGQPMWIDLKTPSWQSLLEIEALCATILGVCFFLRSRLLRRNEQPQ